MEREGRQTIDSFYYSRKKILLGLIPAFIALMFGLELAVFRVIFPKGGSVLLSLLGWVCLCAGLLGLILIAYKMIDRRPFIILTDKGLLASVVIGRGGYLLFPWQEILDVSQMAYRTGAVDTQESPLMTAASYDDYVILKLAPSFKQARFMVQTYDFGEHQLGLSLNMIDGRAGDIVNRVRSVWLERTGRSQP